MTRAAAACALLLLAPAQTATDLERLPFAPRQAICYRTSGPVAVDGRLDEDSWRAAAWSDTFVDIEGDARPAPRFSTRMKMLWDDQNLYVAADLEEPHIWATLTTRDSVIYQENDFEVFIDPDGDTHEYYELEINALNTVWDLLLIRPYRDGGPAVNAWDISGLRTAIHLRGTVNRPQDRDDGWSLEIAMPWKVLAEAAPGARAPRAGEQWRMNFSRVQWQLDVKNGQYVKRSNAKGETLPENNWVWSPQSAIAMHMPERWGYVQFSESSVVEPVSAGADVGQPLSRAATFIRNPDEETKWALRRLYYRQADYRKAHGKYARTIAALGASTPKLDGLQLHATDDQYLLTARSRTGGVVTLRQDGRVWRSESRK
jgi:hypothetical protein